MKDQRDASSPNTSAPLFVGLWALYILVHQFKQTPWHAELSIELAVTRVALIGAAIGVIWRLNNAWWFTSMLALQVLAVCCELPAMSNCWLFSGFVSLGVLLVAVRSRIRLTDSSLWTNQTIYEHAAPLLRCSLLTLYVFAALAKFNWGFLDVQQSSAALFNRIFLDAIGLTEYPQIIDQVSIYSALVIESMIPVLLLVPKTRRFGIVVGMIFHTVLAHNPRVSVYDFTAMVFALYVTFAPEDLLARIGRSRHTRFMTSIALQRRPLIVILTLIAVIVALFGSRATIATFGAGIWLAAGLALTITTVLALCANSDMKPADLPSSNGGGLLILRGLHISDALVVGLIAFNGLTPYLGLKTGMAYTMFSNLRTEKGFANHLFMPTKLRVFDMQDDPIKILKSSHPLLAKAAANDETMLLYDLRLRSDDMANDSVTYLHRGRVVDVARICDDPVLGKPLPSVAKKTLYFRSIPSEVTTPPW